MRQELLRQRAIYQKWEAEGETEGIRNHARDMVEHINGLLKESGAISGEESGAICKHVEVCGGCDETNCPDFQAATGGKVEPVNVQVDVAEGDGEEKQRRAAECTETLLIVLDTPGLTKNLKKALSLLHERLLDLEGLL